MRSALLLTCLLLMIAIIARSQPGGWSIKGRVLDMKTHKPIPAASVQVVLRSSGVSRFGIANDSGYFSLAMPKRGDIRLVVSAVGYKSQEVAIVDRFRDTVLPAGDVLLEDNVQLLSTVEVRMGAPPISINGDTTSFAVDSFLRRGNDMVADVVKRMPGLYLDRNGSVWYNGQPIARVLLNGREFPGADQAGLLSDLPANVVDKLQVIDESGKRGAGQGIRSVAADKVLNIELKKGKRSGFFSKLEAGAGTHGRREGLLSFNELSDSHQLSVYSNNNNINAGTIKANYKFFGSLDKLLRAANSAVENLGGVSSVRTLLQYSDNDFITTVPAFDNGVSNLNTFGARLSVFSGKRLTFYGSYIGYRVANIDPWLSAERQFFGGPVLEKVSGASKSEIVSGHRVFFNLTYAPDSLWSIKLMPSVRWTRDRIHQADSGSSTIEGSLISAYSSYSQVRSRDLAPFVNAIGSKVFPRLHSQLLVTVNWVQNQPIKDAPLVYSFANAGAGAGTGAGAVDSVYMQSHSAVRIDQKRLLLSYVQDLGRWFKLELYYDHSRTITHTAISADYLINGGYMADPSQSGLWENESISRRTGANVKYSGRHIEVAAGADLNALRYKQDITHSALTDGTVRNLSPLVSIQYHPNKTTNLTGTIRSQIRAASPLLLINAPDSTVASYQIKGNSQLRPETELSVETGFNKVSFRTGLFVNISARYGSTHNKIVPAIDLLPNGKIMQSYRNSDVYNETSLFYNFSKPFRNKTFEITYAGSLSLLHYRFYHADRFWDVRDLDHTQMAEFGYNRQRIELRVGGSFMKPSAIVAGSDISIYKVGLFETTTIYPTDGLKVAVNMAHTSPYHLPNGRPFTILDGVIEQRVTKSLTLGFRGLDLFDQGRRSIDHFLSGNSIIDNQHIGVLGRYFLVSARLRVNFFGKSLWRF